MKLFLIAAFAVTCASPAFCSQFTNLNKSQQQELFEIGNQMRACADFWALMEGSKSCHPPSEIIPAIHAQCEVEEVKLRAFMDRTHNSDLTEGLLKEEYRRWVPRLTRIILDAQRSCGRK